MDRELNAILELPFITIMAVMIAIFCRFKMTMHKACRNSYLLLFEGKNGDLRRFSSVNQKPGEFHLPPPTPFLSSKSLLKHDFLEKSKIFILSGFPSFFHKKPDKSVFF